MSRPVIQGEAYCALSGQWAWRIFEDGIVARSGAGYATEDEAYIDMLDELTSVSDARREYWESLR